MSFLLNILKTLFCATLIGIMSQMNAMELQDITSQANAMNLDGCKEVSLGKEIEKIESSPAGNICFVVYKDETAALLQIESEPVKLIKTFEGISEVEDKNFCKEYSKFNFDGSYLVLKQGGCEKLVNAWTGEEIDSFDTSVYSHNRKLLYCFGKEISLIKMESGKCEKIKLDLCCWGLVAKFSFDDEFLFVQSGSEGFLIETRTGKIIKELKI
jgi:hypothetical protein